LRKKFAARKISGTLIFDGTHKRDEESGLSYPSPLIVAYAPNDQSADEYIIEKVRMSLNAKQTTVVTNDKGLSRHAKSYGAKVLSSEDFLIFLNKKQKVKSKNPVESQANFDRLLHIFEERLKRELEE
jgi:predicted RNA-binding protein with PIN domain